jgi:predicted aminopeptidase
MISRRWSLLGVLLPLAWSAALPGCTTGYVVRAGWYQAEMLARREPIDEVLARGGLSAGQEQRLRLVPSLKSYGRGIGLSATDNYDSLAVGWERTVWNVSAAQPLSFENETWWFPVVGRVPYLGYFVEADARAEGARLSSRGLDVSIRTAGAYSTLGWFRDPILPHMLRWSDSQLAETVFHELAHATLWVPGSVAFNESFASFVGDTAARAWLVDTYGASSTEVARWDREQRDSRRFTEILHGLYGDLDAVYRDPSLDEAARRARKSELYGTLAARVEASPIEDRATWLSWVARGTWNNARLAQFRTYASHEDDFAALHASVGGDLGRFIAAVRETTRGADDPFEALRAATVRGAAAPSP